MHAVFKFNRGIITNTSKYNLVDGLDLKKPMKVPLSKKCLLSKPQWKSRMLETFLWKYKMILDM